MNIAPIPGFSEPFSSISHLLAAVAAFFLSFWLYSKGSGNRTRFFSLFIFSFSLVFLFSMSGVYHLLEPGHRPRAVLQRLDHAAIWVLIAGTFTPIHTLLFRGVWRTWFLVVIWTVAITGMTLEAVFFDDVPEWLSLSFYLGLGWMGMLSAWKYLLAYGKRGAKLMFFGGMSYSIGAIMEYQRWPELWPGVVGPHEIFHIFIIIGAGFFWVFIYQRAGHPIISILVADVVERPGNDYSAKIRGDNISVQGKSLDEIKINLKSAVESRFPLHVRPRDIELRLKKVDVIHLPR